MKCVVFLKRLFQSTRQLYDAGEYPLHESFERPLIMGAGSSVVLK